MQETLKAKRIMVRKQVFITTEQNTRLKSLAESAGKSEGELVREGLDRLLADALARQADWLAGMTRIHGLWADRHELEVLYKTRRQRRQQRRVDIIRRSGSENND